MKSERKKKRSANFSNIEKSVLINIISKHKHTIEDSVSARDKNKAWKQIAQEINSSGPTCPRDVDCLKRCYDNRQKLLRRSVASQKREVYRTGGGLPNFNINDKK